MNIVILDGYTENPGDLSWEPFRALGACTIYDRTSLDPADSAIVIERARGAQAVITNKTPITRTVMEALPELRYIGVLATGFNVVDVAAAKERGIAVSNIPTYGTAAVAQYTTALLLELCHHAGAHSASVLRGDWQNHIDWCYWNYPLTELAGKTIGLVGYGRIGRAVAGIMQALGLHVLAYDVQKPAAAETVEFVSLDTLYGRADIISLHCPLTEENRGMINKKSIAKMKTGVLLINTARGPLVCEQDLCDALVCGQVAGAAVDVVSTEPITADNPLLHAKNIIITPHIAWASRESRQRLMDIAVDNLKQFLAGHPVNIVNR